MIKKVLFSIILFIFSLFSFSNSAFASNILFQDDFSGDTSKWTAWSTWTTSSDIWKIENGQYNTTMPRYQNDSSNYSAVANPNSLLWSDYIVEADLSSSSGPDQIVIFRSDSDLKNFYGVILRYNGCADCGNIIIAKMVNGSFHILDDIQPSKSGIVLDWNKNFHIKIITKGGNFQIFVNNILISNITETDKDSPFLTGKVALWSFCGGWVGGVNHYFDNILVTDNISSTSKTPIVFLPGFGGSWNLNNLLTNSSSGSWKKTPFVKVYDNLKNTLLSPEAGYTENSDYYEFYYDWRKKINLSSSNNDLVYDLKQYIDNTVLAGKPSDTKVYLVGHSMGGLLARAYAQEYGTAKIEKIITIGSPHEGVIPSYYAWEGGETEDKLNWTNVALQLLLQVNKNKFQTNLDAIRSLAPSVQDLLPIFDYLKNTNSNILSVDTLNQQNTWLKNLKSGLDTNTKNLLTTIYGKETNPNEDTIEWIKTTSPSWLDNIQGKWIDGKPTAKEYTPYGDLTVLQKSASIIGTTTPEVSGDHGQIISSEAGIKKILDALGLTNVNPITTTNNPARNPSLIFFLHSPANLKVIGPDGEAGEGVASPLARAIYSSEDKLLIIPQALDGDYQIQITGTGNGDYKLDIGQLTNSQDYWNTIQGTITTAATNTYTINFNANSPQDLPIQDASGKSFLILAKNKLENLKAYLETNISSFTTRKRLQFSLDSSIKNINKAITLIDQNNSFSSSRQTQTVLADVLDIRSSFNSFYKNKQFNETTYVFSQNELMQTSDLLIKAWINLYKSSNKVMGLSAVKNFQQAALSSKNSAKLKMQAKISGQDKNTGAIYDSSENSFNKAETYLNNNQLNEAYIYYFLSRTLSNEILQYLK